MGLAVPIIGAAVGVASTASQISSQRSAANRQNAAIGAQISTNKKSEEIRRAAANAQLEILKRTDESQKIAAKTQYLETKNQLNQARNQSRLSQRQAVTQIQGNSAQADLQNQFNQEQIAAEVAASGQANQEQETQLLNTLAQALGQVDDPTPQLENLKREIDNVSAQVLSSSAGGRTSKIQTDNQQLIEETMRAIAQGNEIDSQAAIQIANSEEFRGLLDQITNQSAGLATQSNAVQLRNTLNQNDFALRNTRLQGKAFRNQVRDAKQLANISRNIDNQQRRVNLALSQANLRSGVALSEAQSATQNIALASQSVRSPGLITGIAGITQQLAPLAQMIGTSSGGGTSGVITQQPRFGTTTLPPIISRPQPTSAHNFQFNNRGTA